MKKLIFLVLVLIHLTGCGSRKFLEKITPPEDDQFARELIEHLRNNDLDYIISHFDASALGETPKETMMQLYAYFDHDPPKNIEVAGCYIGYFKMNNAPGQKQTNLTYQIEFPNSWYTANIVIITEDAAKKAYGFHINKIPASLEEINRFTFKEKGLGNYLILILAILIPIFILFTLGVCIVTKVKQKWLWIIFILFGLSKADLNWTTGQLFFNPLSIYVQFLGAAIYKAGWAAPWVLTISLPLGAIMFWVLKRKITISKTELSEPTAGNGFDSHISGNPAPPPLPEDGKYFSE